MMQLEQDAPVAKTALRSMAIGGRITVHPAAQMIAFRQDSQGEPVPILDLAEGSASPGDTQVIDAAGGIVGVAMIALHFVARRILLPTIQMRLAPDIDPAIAPSAFGVRDANFREQLEICELLVAGEITLPAASGQHALFHFPMRGVSESVLAPAIEIPPIEQFDPTPVPRVD